MAWIRVNVVNEGFFGRDQDFVTAVTNRDQTRSSRNERAVNLDHVIYWLGGGAEEVHLALTNGQFLSVAISDQMMEVLTGTYPKVLNWKSDLNKAADHH